jgi:hypothetical protein
MSFHWKARFMRDATGSKIAETLAKAAGVLGAAGIAHLVCGGFAVQEYGYARFTSDVDLIVPDIDAAREALCADGFKPNPGSRMTVTDRATRVEVDLLPGGGTVDPRSPVLLPMPLHVSSEPVIISLPDLISIKLSSFMGAGLRRSQDQSDVVQLTIANDLPRDFAVHVKVAELYITMWDQL